MSTEVLPYKNTTATKKEQVAEMFDKIAYRYDFLNQLFSLGIHKSWRKKVVKELKKEMPSIILDVATGTADLAIEISKLNPQKIVGVDISIKMLELGNKKVKEKLLDKLIELKQADSENLPFSDNTFDAATVAFGVRNFENINKGLKDIQRILKPGAKLIVLEFSKPKNFWVKKIYRFYFIKIIPAIGNFFSNNSAAYSYLPESVDAFPDGEKFIEIMKQCGFKDTGYRQLSFGIASIYTGKK